MSCYNDKCSHHHDKCCHGCNDGLAYFHETLLAGIKEFQQSNDHLMQAIKALEITLYLLEESFEENQEGSKYLQDAFKWLEKYGCHYSCNYDSPECKKLEYKARQEFDKAQSDEAEALKLAKYALDKLYSAKQDYVDGTELTDKLVKCIHKDMC